ncbi:MAG: TonB-dependent receptor [Verrucomicrobia bacterium]|nr:TonB-dependent receptor [Verrucomicrobiota bacterium]
MKSPCFCLSLILWSGASLFDSPSLSAAPSPESSTLEIEPSSPVPLPTVVVYGRDRWSHTPLSAEILNPRRIESLRARDAAELLLDVPGAAVVRNGTQTGIPQLHGLWGDRVRVAVDGMNITPACPNHMDPPLHYAAPSSVDSLRVMAGITPVSLGGDSLGGTVALESPPPRFATNDSLLYYGELGTRVSTGDDGLTLNGAAGLANRRLSAGYEGSSSTARDYRYPDGTVRDTAFDIQHHRVQLGANTKPGLVDLDLGWGRTRDAGTPALPMDMIRDDSFRAGLGYRGELPVGNLESRLYYHEIDHLMDNYTLRPARGPRMFSPATSDDFGLRLGWDDLVQDHLLGIGFESFFNRFEAYQQNATTGMQQDTFRDVSRDRIGAYAEWLGFLESRWQPQLGVRADTVIADAADVERSFAPAAADRARFNALDHQQDEVNLDVTATLRHIPNRHSTYELGFARKNRAPNIIEWFLWTPLSASAGQADGRSYLGNLDLDSETSHQVAFTADYHGTNWQVKISPYYNHVTDFIQGTPIPRLDANQQPVLQYQNFNDAQLYGVDARANWDVTRQLTLRGTLSYVRGRNLDTDDNLYRIAPLHGTVAADLHWGVSLTTIEVVLADRQDEVAQYNEEPPTPAYALLNLRTRFQLNRHLELELGLNNVFDTDYTDHLGGINRVLESDVAVGQRLPGIGRSLYVSLSARL